MSDLTIIRWDPITQSWLEQHVATEPGAMIVLPGAPVERRIVRIRTRKACNIRNAPSLAPITDVGDLAAGKILVGEADGDFYTVTLYVHRSTVEELGNA